MTRIKNRYAWLPTKIIHPTKPLGRKWIWLRKYYALQTYEIIGVFHSGIYGVEDWGWVTSQKFI